MQHAVMEAHVQQDVQGYGSNTCRRMPRLIMFLPMPLFQAPGAIVRRKLWEDYVWLVATILTKKMREEAETGKLPWCIH